MHSGGLGFIKHKQFQLWLLRLLLPTNAFTKRFWLVQHCAERVCWLNYVLPSASYYGDAPDVTQKQDEESLAGETLKRFLCACWRSEWSMPGSWGKGDKCNYCLTFNSPFSGISFFIINIFIISLSFLFVQLRITSFCVFCSLKTVINIIFKCPTITSIAVTLFLKSLPVLLTSPYRFTCNKSQHIMYNKNCIIINHNPSVASCIGFQFC